MTIHDRVYGDIEVKEKVLIVLINPKIIEYLNKLNPNTTFEYSV